MKLMLKFDGSIVDVSSNFTYSLSFSIDFKDTLQTSCVDILCDGGSGNGQNEFKKYKKKEIKVVQKASNIKYSKFINVGYIL